MANLHGPRALAIAAACSLFCAGGLAGEKSEPLSVSMEFLQKDFALLEPVFLKVTLRNTGKEAIRVIYPDMRAGLEIAVKYKSKKLEWVPESGPRRVHFETLRPGGTGSVVINLLEFFGMKRSGTYSVSVRYGNPGVRPKDTAFPKSIVSKKFKIVVRHPTEQESKAIDDVDNDGDLCPDAYDMAAAKILVLHKSLPYHKYAYYWLGEGERVSFHEKEALYCYEKLLKEQPKFPLAEKVRYRMLLLREELGKVKNATKDLKEMMEKVEDLELRRTIRWELTKRKQAKEAAPKK